MTFVEGEQPLSSWMAKNAYVSWVVYGRPWELEDELIAELDIPLNLQWNLHSRFHSSGRCAPGASLRPGP